MAVVFNNGQWGAEKKNQVDYFNSRFLGTNLKNPNFADVAEAPMSRSGNQSMALVAGSKMRNLSDAVECRNRGCYC